MKKLIASILAAFVVCAAAVSASAAESPKSVIHVVTVAWKKDAAPEQIQAAIDGVKTLAEAYPGITRIWLRSIKVQNPRGTEVPRTTAFVMEFKDEQALKDYADSDAQKKWYEVYTPVREESTSHDITN